ETVNGGKKVDRQYDADGLLVAAGPLTIAPDPKNGRITGTAIGDVTDVTTYDMFGAPATYTASYKGTPQLAFQYTRDALGRITKMVETVLGATHTFEYTYDLAGRLTEVKKDGGTTAKYGYDANGNRTSYTDG